MAVRNKGPLVLSLLIITVGVGWLLTVQGLVPNVNWVWTLGLAVVGLLSFVVSGGIDKVSVIVGPLLIFGSILSVLRQTERLRIDSEVPILVIAAGALLFVAQLPFIPAPRWLISLPPERE